MAFLGGFKDFLYVPGQVEASFAKQALSKAADFACQLYKDHPGMVTPFDPFGFGRGIWDELCQARSPGLPLPPSVPFTGGQCPVVYQIAAVVSYENLSSTDTFNLGSYWGPIKSVVFTPSVPAVSGYYGKRHDLSIKSHGSGSGAYQQDVIETVQRPFGNLRLVESISVSRVDGQPDDCGNLSAVYPPVVLPPASRTTNITIDSNNTSFVIPTVVILPSADIDLNLNVPLVINMGGLHFHVNSNGFHSGEPGGTTSPDAKKDAKDIKDKLDDIASPLSPDEDPRLTPTYPPIADSGEKDELSGAKWIKIDLTTLPDKAQYSRSGRAVYFAGWLEFHKEGYALPRQQINYQRSIFRFPDGADGYSYTFTNGAAGALTVYTEEKEKDG